MNTTSEKMDCRRFQRGLSLIEVMIAVLVLSTGLMALAALQGALSRNAADARARSQVAAFVDLVTERYRSAGGGANFASVAATNQVWTADEVTALSNAAGVNNVGVGVTATHYAFRGSPPSFQVCDATCAAGLRASDAQYKEVTVRVGWTDATGAVRSYDATTIMSPRTLTASRTVYDMATSGGSSAPKNPIVRTNSPVEAGVIPIAIGGGSETAATNPKPEIAGKNNNQSVVGTSYEVLTYRNEGSDTVRIQRRVETKVIGCVCSPNAAPTGDFFSTPQWPAHWNGERYVVFTPENKGPAPGSTRNTGPATGVVQDELCTDCCRDHHDNVAVESDDPVVCTEGYSQCNEDIVKFDPFRATHAHFRLDGSGQLVAAGSTENYLEACRMIRVDGFWRTAADLNLEHLGLLATTNSARSAIPSETAVKGYEKFVIDFVKGKFSGGPLVTADRAFDDNGLNAPENIDIRRPAPKDERYMHARGLYIDYLERKAAKKLAEAFAECTKTNKEECVLPFLPFTTINTTELAFWESARIVETDPAPNTVLSVASGSSLIFNPLQPTRGRVNAVSSAPSGTPSALAVAKLGKSNSGVAIYRAIDPDDDLDLVDSQKFTLSAGTATGAKFNVVLSGLPQLSDANTSNDPAVAWTVGGDSDDCRETYVNKRDTNPNPYVCNTTSALNTDVLVQVARYNRQRVVSETVSVTCGGLTANWASAQYCDNYEVASASVGGMTGTRVPGGVEGGITSEFTNITLLIPPGSQVDVTFTLQGSQRVTTPASCTLSNNGQRFIDVTWAACP
jgi:prepilin-type N-terminal cleavage/methylation domain-containing protein